MQIKISNIKFDITTQNFEFEVLKLFLENRKLHVWNYRVSFIDTLNSQKFWLVLLELIRLEVIIVKTQVKYIK